MPNGRAFSLTIISLAFALLVAGRPSGVAYGAAAGDPDVVQTDKGSVRGSLTNGVRAFLGIPFAAPPVGPLRFNPPKPATAWNGVRDATQPGAACPQTGTSPQNATEDCLFLNVWAPSAAAKTPVLVFIYGGGFTQGSGADYDGTLLAATGKIVVVTMNYRIGILGFLANGAIGGSASGNFGLEDQQAALRWVQRNIGAFGGEPRNVTLGGESAGAVSACANLASPGSTGFERAIVQSAPCSVPLPTLTDREAAQAPIAAQLGCTGSDAQIAACLRSPDLTVQKILTLQQTLPPGTFSPSVEGSDVPVQPRTYLGRIPLLLGGNITDTSICDDVRSWRLTRATTGAPIYAYESTVHGLSASMIPFWKNFVTNGDPNGPGLEQWLPYKLDTDVMQFAPSGAGMGVDVGAEHKCKI